MGLMRFRNFQASAAGAVRGAQALEWPAPSPPGPKSNQIGPKPVMCGRDGAARRPPYPDPKEGVQAIVR